MNEIIQLLLFALCLSGAFFFAGVETGFVSWNPLKISHRAGLGDTNARWALYLMNHQDRVISSVLIGSNMCVIGATLVFLDLIEIVANNLSIDLAKLPSAESWILTPFVVMFCEMLPKSLFRTYPFQLTIRSVPLLLGTYYLTLPITWSVSTITKLLKRTKEAQSHESYLTKVREEMVLIAGEGSRSGTLIESADKYIHSILNLKDRTVGDLMIPIDDFLNQTITINASTTIADLKQIRFDHDYVIVVNESGTGPAGILQLIEIIGSSEKSTIARFVKPLDSVKSTNPVLSVFNEIMKSFYRYIIVLNEEMKCIGMIDKEDLIRTIFGGVRSNFSER